MGKISLLPSLSFPNLFEHLEGIKGISQPIPDKVDRDDGQKDGGVQTEQMS